MRKQPEGMDKQKRDGIRVDTRWDFARDFTVGWICGGISQGVSCVIGMKSTAWARSIEKTIKHLPRIQEAFFTST
ncbi:hypothetical protein VNO80_01229 [Phaseolus coccineus]|uniref:Uncharacterized protein n=1 Tax=Phaseolus coccineus TaxID=3886 RepID=A0AAN9P4P2_PHACN